MKLCRYDDNKIGLVRGRNLHDVTAILDALPPLRYPVAFGDHLIANLENLRPRMEELADKAAPQPVDKARLLSPVANPSKIIGTPANYHAHVEEARRDAEIAVYSAGKQRTIEEQGLFLKAASSLVGPSEGVAIRFPERRNEHEVELAIIFGKQGSDIPRDKALDYVAGYAIGLDMTARGKEDRSFRKSIDSYSVLGPWIVTADEIPDPDNVPLTISVNGEVKQKSNTSQLIYDCRKLIEWGSTFYTFYPGDVLYTGTPEGVSPVKPGDTMLAKIDPIGEMTVPVRAHTIGG